MSFTCGVCAESWVSPSGTGCGMNTSWLGVASSRSPALISLARMRWAGHLIRMGNERLPKKILFGALAEGKGGRGKRRKQLADKYESDFHALAQANGFTAPSRPTRATAGQVSQSWWTPAADKVKWRACIDSAWPRKPPAP